MRTLIVEDDQSIREVLKLYLCDKQIGMHCDTASTLSQAIALVSHIKYDLIILDILLEGELGTPLVDYVRKLYPKDTPGICMMSAMKDGHKIAEKSGVHYFSKPFGLETLDEFVVNKKCS